MGTLAACKLVDTNGVSARPDRWTGSIRPPLHAPLQTQEPYPVSKLLAIIDTYKDRHGQPSDSSIARAVGVAPQTISSWRTRGIRDLPNYETLTALAGLVGLSYRAVLDAALVDAKYLAPELYREPEWPPKPGEVRGA